MSFELRVNGEVVKRFDDQVIGVSLQSQRGELYKAGISNEGVIDVRVHTVNPGDPPRLDQLEAMQRQQTRSMVEGLVSGPSEFLSDPSMLRFQELPDVHQRGKKSKSKAETGSHVPPAVDLAQGLEGIDTADERYQATVNARVEAFNNHGDAQRAVDENPLQSNEASFDLTGSQTEPETEPVS